MIRSLPASAVVVGHINPSWLRLVARREDYLLSAPLLLAEFAAVLPGPF